MAPLVVENVVKSFTQGDRNVQALAGVTLTVPRGRFVAVMGASGSGKSTLLHLMAGLTHADSGRIVIDGAEIGAMGDRELTLFRRKHIGLVFQAFNLIPTLTAEENVALPLMLERRLTAGDQAKVNQMLQRLGLSPRRHHRPDALSGGEQQRVAIGRALIAEPAVLLADEPTGNLDSANSNAVCELLQKLSRSEGKTIVMVTHEPSVAAYADDVAVIRDGKLVAQFPVEQHDGEKLAIRYQECLR